MQYRDDNFWGMQYRDNNFNQIPILSTNGMDGDMWQGVGACGRGGDRVWGHVAGVGVCGRGSGLCHGWGYVAGCGGMWLGSSEFPALQSYKANVN